MKGGRPAEKRRMLGEGEVGLTTAGPSSFTQHPDSTLRNRPRPGGGVAAAGRRARRGPPAPPPPPRLPPRPRILRSDPVIVGAVGWRPPYDTLATAASVTSP